MKDDSNRRQGQTSEAIATIVSRYRASGLGLERFARQHGIPPGRLHYWLYRKHPGARPGGGTKSARVSWSRDRESDHSGTPVNPGGPAEPAPVGGSQPPVEPVAIVAGDWRNGAGQLKYMAARTLLVKLEQRGLIQLPVRRRVPTNRMRCGVPPAIGQCATVESIDCGLAELEPLSLAEVSGQRPQRAWVKAALARFHYLGFGGPARTFSMSCAMARTDPWLAWCSGRRPGSAKTGTDILVGASRNGNSIWGGSPIMSAS
ncbi:MAG: hypothetical protein NT154_25435 [Verrucomicrobia bacterium]|nr:hypothetical protein [Verrucomicrobiota bacterium]